MHGEEVVFRSRDLGNGIDEGKQLSQLPSNTTKISFQTGDVENITDGIDGLELSEYVAHSDQDIIYEKKYEDCCTLLSKQLSRKKITGILKNTEFNLSNVKPEESEKSLHIERSKNAPEQTKHRRKNENSARKRDNLKKNNNQDIPPLVKVEESLTAWYTIDTLRLIKGDDFVRQVLRENGCTVSSVVAAVGISPAEGNVNMCSEFREKYIQLCRRLDLQDLEVNKKNQK